MAGLFYANSTALKGPQHQSSGNKKPGLLPGLIASKRKLELNGCDFAIALLLSQNFLESFKILFGDLGLHRAVLGSTHRAELGLLVDVSRKGLVVIFLRPLRIEGEFELLVPVEVVAGAAELCLLYTSDAADE